MKEYTEHDDSELPEDLRADATTADDEVEEVPEGRNGNYVSPKFPRDRRSLEFRGAFGRAKQQPLGDDEQPARATKPKFMTRPQRETLGLIRVAPKRGRGVTIESKALKELCSTSN